MMKVSDLAEYFTNKLGDMQDYQFGMCIEDANGNYHLFNIYQSLVEEISDVIIRLNNVLEIGGISVITFNQV